MPSSQTHTPSQHAPVAAWCFLSKLCAEMGYGRDPREAPPPGGQKISSRCATILLYVPFPLAAQGWKDHFLPQRWKRGFLENPWWGKHSDAQPGPKGTKWRAREGQSLSLCQGLLGQLILFALNTSPWHTRCDGFAVVTLYCGKVCYFFFFQCSE